MKKSVQIAFGMALACLSGAAWAMASGPGDTGMGTLNNSIPGSIGMGYSGANTAPGAIGMGGGFTMPVNPGILANTYAGAGMGSGYSNTMPNGSVGMPMLDLRQVVMQGISSLQPQQRDQLGMNMAYQNLQGMAGGTSPVNQIRNSVRDSIMTSRVASISPLGQGTFRPMIQPGAVQSMISQIQPWNFPARFQSAMMPAMIPVLSQPIKQQQMAYMQQGIMNNPNFPNVPLPAPAFSPYNNGGYYPQQQQPGGMMMGGGGYSMPPGGMGMMGGGYGMPPGGMGMGGYYPQQQQGGYYYGY